jgi:type III secretion system low calcium response chaperone LcrH/SycD
MNTEEISEQDADFVAEKIGEHFQKGGTLGDLRGFTDSHYELMYAKAHQLYTLEQYEEAGKVFGFLATNNPYDLRFMMGLGAALQMQGKYADAIGSYTMCIALDMQNPVPVFHVAECLSALGQTDDAKEMLAAVVERASQPAHQALKQRAAAMLQIMQGTGKESV